jgi:hypothetical protein
MLRIPHCLDNRLTDGCKVVSPTHRPLFYSPETFFMLLVLISVRGSIANKIIRNPGKEMLLVKPEGKGRLKWRSLGGSTILTWILEIQDGKVWQLSRPIPYTKISLSRKKVKFSCVCLIKHSLIKFTRKTQAWIELFLNSPPAGCERSASRSERFIPRWNSFYLLYKKLGGSRHGLDGEEEIVDLTGTRATTTRSCNWPHPATCFNRKDRQIVPLGARNGEVAVEFAKNPFFRVHQI